MKLSALNNKDFLFSMICERCNTTLPGVFKLEHLKSKNPPKCDCGSLAYQLKEASKLDIN